MSLIKDSVIMTFSKGIRAFVMLILTMLMSRVMMEDTYGTYRQIMLIVTLCTAIIPLGIPVTISYFYQNINAMQKSKLVNNTLIISSVLSISVICIINIFSFDISVLFNNSNLVDYLFILSLYIAIIIAFSYLENLYISSGHALILGIINIIFFIIYFIIIAIEIIFFNKLYTIILTMTILEVIKSVYMLYKIYNLNKYEYLFDISFMKKQMGYAMPLGLTVIIQTINLYTDNLFISSNFTPTEYAIYSTGATEVPFISIITISLATVALPQMSKLYNTDHDFQGVLEVWSKTTKSAAAIIFPVFWILLFYNAGYIKFIFSEKYLATTPVFIVYLFRLLLSCTVFSNILIILKKQKVIVKNMLIGIMFNITMNFLLIKIFGMLGAAISSMLMHSLLVILQLYQISKFSNYKVSHLLPFRELLKLLIVPGLISSIVWIISLYFNFGQVINLFIYGGIIFIITMILYYKYNFIPQEIINKYFKKIFKKIPLY